MDSFIEVLSGVGILHMVIRMKTEPVTSHSKFERQALRITGTAFYILAGGLVAGAVLSIINMQTPVTTRVGIIISIISIMIMYFLYRAKLNVGKKLNSEPVIADANCTKACFYLSFILLASSLIYELFEVPFIDAAGSLGIAWYAFKEGKESFEKAKQNKISCEDCG